MLQPITFHYLSRDCYVKHNEALHVCCIMSCIMEDYHMLHPLQLLFHFMLDVRTA